MPNVIGNLKVIGGVYSRMYEESGRVYDTNDISPTVHTQSGGGQGIKILVNENETPLIRRLTPRECLRLQDFDDSDIDKIEKVCSNTQLYRQAGNSIPVGMLVGVLKNLLLPDSTKTKDLSKWLDELLGV